MGVAGSLTTRSRAVLGEIYRRLPLPGISRPTFIIGCGRSGTTILGTCLSKHGDITYLNEPRHLWFTAIPEADVWTDKANTRGGKLALTEADVDRTKSAGLSRLFRLETIMSGRPVLVEKLPINSFRLGFLHRAFPDARYIHIFRNGLEVAKSIEKESNRGKWFGSHSYKWDQLVGYAESRDDTRGLPALCTNYREMGLLEWRLSTEAIVAFLRRVGDAAFVEINYDLLVADPVASVLQLQDFIGVRQDPKVAEFAAAKVTRKSTGVGRVTLMDKDALLGGKLLPLSMDGERVLTKRST